MSGTTVRGPLAGFATLQISVNGAAAVNWTVVGELEFQPSGFANETLKGQTAVEGFRAMPDQGYISATLRDQAGQAISQFKGASGISMVGILANGKAITLSNGWTTELGALNTQEGTFDLHVESDDVTEDTV